jgi:hypothetical protein
MFGVCPEKVGQLSNRWQLDFFFERSGGDSAWNPGPAYPRKRKANQGLVQTTSHKSASVTFISWNIGNGGLAASTRLAAVQRVLGATDDDETVPEQWRTWFWPCRSPG